MYDMEMGMVLSRMIVKIGTCGLRPLGIGEVILYPYQSLAIHIPPRI